MPKRSCSLTLLHVMMSLMQHSANSIHDWVPWEYKKSSWRKFNFKRSCFGRLPTRMVLGIISFTSLMLPNYFSIKVNNSTKFVSEMKTTTRKLILCWTNLNFLKYTHVLSSFCQIRRNNITDCSYQTENDSSKWWN